ncbi:MAG: hypothetical protein ACPGSL_04875 [Vicingaceae bacterium]
MKIRSLNLLLFVIIIISFNNQNIFAQKVKTLSNYVITSDSLNSSVFREFIGSKIASSQFIMVGEQHGLREVGEITSLIYNIAQPFGYKHLCIETDAVAAKQIEKNASGKKPAQLAKENYKSFPHAIPFYNNYDDYQLFSQVIKSQGDVWGIDQTFMAQFRLNFDYIENTTSNELLKEEVIKLKAIAIASFEKAIEEKDFMAPFIFQYSDELHNELMGLTKNDFEKEILNQLKITKEIYMLNFAKQSYLSNLKRAQLMKQNFLKYYKSETESEKHPKVVFKMGANHVSRGLNGTNVYDISNLVSELAIINGMESTHILVTGINGESTIGNPFAPVPTNSFDNTEDFPEEVQQSIEELNKKYFILDLSQLRPNTKSYSSKMQEWMFKYDIVVLIKDANYSRPF